MRNRKLLLCIIILLYLPITVTAQTQNSGTLDTSTARGTKYTATCSCPSRWETDTLITINFYLTVSEWGSSVDRLYDIEVEVTFDVGDMTHGFQRQTGYEITTLNSTLHLTVNFTPSVIGIVPNPGESIDAYVAANFNFTEGVVLGFDETWKNTINIPVAATIVNPQQPPSDNGDQPSLPTLPSFLGTPMTIGITTGGIIAISVCILAINAARRTKKPLRSPDEPVPIPLDELPTPPRPTQPEKGTLDTQYCQACGSELPPATQTCPICGFINQHQL